MGQDGDGKPTGNDPAPPDVIEPMTLATAALETPVVPTEISAPAPAIGRAGSASPATTWDAELVNVYKERYHDFVRLAYLLTGQPAVAEEIVQDAFIASQRSWDGVRDPAPYVRAAVTNRCYSWGRRLKLERERQPAPPDPAELGADEMWDALQELNERQRVAIVLRYYADLPDKEIAAVLGCRVPTVRTAIHRGLKALRKVIQP